jgi:hypothetical protein
MVAVLSTFVSRTIEQKATSAERIRAEARLSWPVNKRRGRSIESKDCFKSITTQSIGLFV